MPKTYSCALISSILVASTLYAIPCAAQENEENFTPVMYSSIFVINIGYRPNQRAGERSSLRWLSRSIKDAPGLTSYVVKWHTYRNKKKLNVSIGYIAESSTIFKSQSASTKPVKDEEQYKLPVYEQNWRPVSSRTLHAVANKNGTLAKFDFLK